MSDASSSSSAETFESYSLGDLSNDWNSQQNEGNTKLNSP